MITTTFCSCKCFYFYGVCCYFPFRLQNVGSGNKSVSGPEMLSEDKSLSFYSNSWNPRSLNLGPEHWCILNKCHRHEIDLSLLTFLRPMLIFLFILISWLWSALWTKCLTPRSPSHSARRWQITLSNGKS